MAEENSRSIVAVDIGGTFTDIVLVRENRPIATKKVLSTPQNYALGIVSGLRELIEESSLSPRQIERVLHATTVATNAILEGKGSRTALITTRGFRDVLELRRIRIPRLYDLFFEKPRPLVPRRHRFEVEERVDAKGNVLVPLNEEEVRTAISKIEAAHIDSVAVCFLNSFTRPAHERRVGELVHEKLPSIYLSLSADILPEIREYERTSTTVINAYIGPLAKSYLQHLEKQLATIRVRCPLLIMQSSGGVMDVRTATRKPAHLIESGPAAGVVAAMHLAKKAGYKDVISFDMGGTTAKASLIENERFNFTSEAEIGSGITLSSRLTKGGGYALKLPMIDLSEVGAGGGSIARLDKGSLKVGPQSSGARPGPVCYDQGGEEITITDANVLLGYINPEYIAGGAVPLNRDKAARIFEQKIAKPMGKDLYPAAFGIHTVANAAMIRAVKAVSTYRGRDPRDFVLFAFGGSGPVHAAHLARELGMRRVVVPPSPGLFSCLGMLLADIEHHLVHTFLGRTTEASVNEINALFSKMEKEGFAQLLEGGYPHHQVVVQRFADLRYEGQAYELPVPIPNGHLEKKDLTVLDEVFGHEHEKEYGHRGVDDPVEMVNLRVTLRVIQDKVDTFRPLAVVPEPHGHVRQVSLQRQAYFGPWGGIQNAPIIFRQALGKVARPGPIIIDEYDSTAVVPPNCQASLDDLGNIVIDIA